MNKEDNFKEKFKQALISTVKVISDDYKLEKEINTLEGKTENYKYEKPDDDEIDIADWFHYQSLPEVPSGSISISGRLIESYVNRLTKKDLPGFT